MSRRTSTLSSGLGDDCDWTKVGDPVKRRQIQNRISKRRQRERARQRKQKEREVAASKFEYYVHDQGYRRNSSSTLPSSGSNSTYSPKEWGRAISSPPGILLPPSDPYRPDAYTSAYSRTRPTNIHAPTYPLSSHSGQHSASSSSSMSMPPMSSYWSPVPSHRGVSSQYPTPAYEHTPDPSKSPASSFKSPEMLTSCPLSSSKHTSWSSCDFRHLDHNAEVTMAPHVRDCRLEAPLPTLPSSTSAAAYPYTPIDTPYAGSRADEDANHSRQSSVINYTQPSEYPPFEAVMSGYYPRVSP